MCVDFLAQRAQAQLGQQGLILLDFRLPVVSNLSP